MRSIICLFFIIQGTLKFTECLKLKQLLMLPIGCVVYGKQLYLSKIIFFNIFEAITLINNYIL